MAVAEQSTIDVKRCVCVCKYVCVCVYVCVYVLVSVWLSVRERVCMCECVRARVCVCVRICACVYATYERAFSHIWLSHGHTRMRLFTHNDESWNTCGIHGDEGNDRHWHALRYGDVLSHGGVYGTVTFCHSVSQTFQCGRYIHIYHMIYSMYNM